MPDIYLAIAVYDNMYWCLLSVYIMSVLVLGIEVIRSFREN